MLLRRAVAVACVLGAAALNPLGSPASAAPPADHKLTPQHLPKPDRSRDPKALSFDPHSVLVQFKPGASAASTDRAVTSRNAKVAGAVAGTRFTRVTTAGAATDLARELGKDPSVASVSLNYRRQASTTPNDPGYTYGDQSYLNTVRMPLAWDRSTGSADQIIAVVDTGVDGQHPDLAGRVLAGYNAITRTAIAAGANSDDYGHGSMVAGIAAADTNNGIGVAGVDWNARILPVKVLDQDGNGYDADIAAGIVWAADHGAKVINLSLGGPGDTPILHDAVTYATGKGSLLVVAAGNSADSEPQYPAAYPEVLAVAATDANGKLTDFSTYGDWVDVAAPGFGIVSTSVPQNGYEYFIGDGTSFAAPIVSGVAALMRANNPALTPAQLLATIKGTARDAGPRGFDKYFGNGVLDAYAALGGGWAPEFPQASLGAGEPNDVPARATAFTAPVTGTIGIEGDVDWYRFDSTGIRSATVTVTSPSYDFDRAQNIDAVLAVYDKDLKLVGQGDDPASGSASVSLTLGAGTYYVAVRNRGGDADDRPYTLAVTDGPGTPQQFQPWQATATGSRPQVVTVGDVTGDGRNDVVLATGYYFDPDNDYKLFVFAQNVDGTLAAPVKYTTQLQSPLDSPALALLDTNGDGRKDVALTSNAGLQLFRQTAAGALTDAGLVAGTAGATRVTAADIDADGDADLIVADTAGSQLLTQGPAGTFTASSVSANGSAEYEVGDVDGDGRTDIVSFSSTAVIVYHNTATGWTETDHAAVHGTSNVGGVEVADLTGDGKADIAATVTGNLQDAKVNVFKQNAAGGLDAPVTYATVDLPQAVEAADITGDGRTDLVTAHPGFNKVSVLPQTTGGQLGTPITAFVPFQGSDTQALALGDVNGDNRIDAVVVDPNSGLEVLRSAFGPTPGGEAAWVKSTSIADFATGVALDAKPTITFARTVDTSTVKLVHGVTGQAVPATVSYDAGTATATITPAAALQDNTAYRVVVGNVFSSTFRTVDTAPAAVTGLQADGATAVVSWTAPAITDLDQVIVRAGTTLPDSVTAGIGLYAGAGTSFTAANLKPGVAYTVRAFTRDRSGKITAGPSVSLTVNAYKLKVDFNGDGNTDVAGIDANSDIKLYKGDGTGKLVGNDGYMWPAGGLWNGFKHIVAADFNGDGKVDIAGIDANNDIKLYTGDGAGKLVGNGSYMWPTGGLWGGFKKIVAGDFNGDGKVDIAGIDANSDLKLYTGDGAGKLTGTGTAMWPLGGLWGGFKHIEAADFNTDGKTDVTGIDANNDIKYYTGDGTGKLVGNGAAMWPTGGLWAGFKWIVAGDFNNDGKADIAGIDANNDIKYYTGDGTGKLVGNGFAMWPQGGLWVGFKQLT
ncbi:hypothetical protein GCM10020218_098870 [Dactylosporangium vinaceum]